MTGDAVQFLDQDLAFELGFELGGGKPGEDWFGECGGCGTKQKRRSEGDQGEEARAERRGDPRCWLRTD